MFCNKVEIPSFPKRLSVINVFLYVSKLTKSPFCATPKQATSAKSFMNNLILTYLIRVLYLISVVNQWTQLTSIP